MTLQFDAPVNYSSLNTSLLQVLSYKNLDSVDDTGFDLDYVAPEKMSYDNITYTVFVDLFDSALNKMKLTGRICKLAGNCYLNVTAVPNVTGPLIVDNRQYGDQPATFSTDAYNVNLWTPDRIQPVIVDNSTTFNLNNSELVLVFDEAVDPGTFLPTKITFFNPADLSHSYTLTGGIVQNPLVLASSVTVVLTDVDVDSIKANNLLAAELSSTAVSFLAGAVEDTAQQPNLLAAYALVNVSVPDGFVDDTTPPILFGWSVDYSRNYLVFTFDEPIDMYATVVFSSSGNISAFITVQADNGGLLAFNLTGGVAKNDTTQPHLVMIALTLDDLLVLKSTTGLLDDASTSWVVTQNSFFDRAGNAMLLNAPQQGTFIADSVKPSVTSFSLNFTDSERRLSLTFDDIVVPSTLRAKAIVVQSDAVGTLTSQLTTASTPTLPVAAFHYQFSLDLNVVDYFAMRNQTGLADADVRSFLSFGADLVEDTYGRGIEAVGQSKGVGLDRTFD